MFTTVLAQIEACLNSWPLTPLSCDDDGVEALTAGHFLFGHPFVSHTICLLILNLQVLRLIHASWFTYLTDLCLIIVSFLRPSVLGRLYVGCQVTYLLVIMFICASSQFSLNLSN